MSDARTHLRLAIPVLFAVAAGGAAGCGNARAASVTTVRDTLVAYGTEAFRLPLVVRDRDGAEPPGWNARLQLSDTGALERDGAYVRCRRAGRTDIAAEVDELRAQLVLHCRPSARFETQFFHELVVGRPATPLVIHARFSADRVERVDPISVAVADSTVVRLVGDSLVPLRAGRTSIAADVGGKRLWIHVSVTEVIADETLALTPGEFRSWTLERGLYEIWVRGLDVTFSRAATELQGEGTRCIRASRDEHSINCRVTERGGVAVRNILAKGPTQRVGVRILKRP